ncbi:MAG: prolipoprotein diacylglyceryl transferase [Acidobacteria bacterium]|nr:MAG: prolipoprotein diacylglyceryl transferase [Acidobacteriota bacterium]
MYPILFRVWNFPVNTYGVFLALAFLGAIFVTVKLGVRDGLPRERLSLVGSKLLMLFTEPEYRQNPRLLFSLDFLRSGGVFYGGLIGAVIAAYILMRRWKLPWWKTADACAPSIALGNVLGRQGCFSAGCCWGKPTNLPWGVRFSELGHEVTGVPIDTKLHPTQLYESFAMLIVFFFLLWLHKKKKFSGQVILAYALIYATVRFLIEFVRDDPRGDILGLTTLTGLSTSQMIGIVVGAAALITLIIRWRRANAAKAVTGTTAASPALKARSTSASK